MKSSSSILVVVGLLLIIGPSGADAQEGRTYQRFKAVLGGQINAPAGVLDKETNLIWEQSPEPADEGLSVNWADAQAHCTTRDAANRLGFRLPTVDELTSLVSLSTLGLPSDHPFARVSQSEVYWSATTTAADPAYAYTVSFAGLRFPVVFSASKAEGHGVWCVRAFGGEIR